MIKLEDKPNTIAPGGAYPFGNIRDDNGSGNGTPLNELVHADFHQFFAKMFNASGLVSNGLVDNGTNGFQYFEALLKIISKRIATLIGTDLDNEITPGVFNIKDSFTNIPAGMSVTANLFITEDSNEIRQLVIDRENGAEWRRVSYDGGATWDAWKLIKFAEKLMPIGTWNIPTGFRVFSHGLQYDQIVSVDVIIRNDAGNLRRPLTYPNDPAAADATSGGTYSLTDDNKITLRYTISGIFDNSAYSDPAVDRGTVLFKYIP